MEHTWRWFGPRDPITLSEIRQTGATGIVTAMHEIPNGEVWPVEAIAARQADIEAAGLTWSVVESIPVHEAIKKGGPERDRLLDAYATSVRNLAACGIDIVCYNFMPVLDWTRTDLAYRLPDGGWALRFDQDAFAAFDLFLLRRPGVEADYDEPDVARARAHLDSLSQTERDRLVSTIIAGLPGAEESYTLDSLRADLNGYADVDAEALRRNLRYFLKAVVPVAEEVGVRMAIHPDDPPRPLLGLARVMSTRDDARWLLDTVDSVANGLTFCTGSYGVREDNDLVAMAREFAPRIYFAHLRSTRREADPRSFHESYHVGGDVDMVGVIRELVREEHRRESTGGPRLPLRSDHGHQLLYDQTAGRRTNPGYSLIGRLKGLAELRGVEVAVRDLLFYGDPAHRRHRQTPECPEIELPKGDVTEGVVRVGHTVRRPRQPQSLAVAAYLDHLERVGFTGSPRYLGRDSLGRDVLTYLDGEVAGDPPERWAADDRLLASVGDLLRRLHQASRGYAAGREFAAPEGSIWGREQIRVQPPVTEPAPELICHLDVTPQNVVVRDGIAVGLIDFDLAGPATRLLDVYNTAMHWVPLRAPEDIWPTWQGIDQPTRLRIFADAYGLSPAERLALPEFGVAHADRSWRRMRAAAEMLGGGWARMWHDGVGDLIRRRQAWLSAHHTELVAALR